MYLGLMLKFDKIQIVMEFQVCHNVKDNF